MLALVLLVGVAAFVGVFLFLIYALTALVLVVLRFLLPHRGRHRMRA